MSLQKKIEHRKPFVGLTGYVFNETSADVGEVNALLHYKLLLLFFTYLIHVITPDHYL